MATAKSSPGRPRRLGQPWYRQAFQEDYLEIYLHRDLTEAARAVHFLSEALALRPAHRLLDLCCGPGRHLVFLGKHVGQAVGLDLSRALLDRAHEHWRSLYPVPRDGANKDKRAPALLLQGDMRHLPLAAGAFDRVVNLFTSFGYFEDEAKNQAVLEGVARVLKPAPTGGEPGGLFAIDHINREVLLAGLKPHTERKLAGGRLLIETRRYDEATRRVIKDVKFVEADGQVKAWCESVRVYEPDELESMLAQAGLPPYARHGDYDGRPWSPQAPRLIILARRGAAKSP